MKIIDISPTLSESTAVFPGDTPFARQILLDFKKKDHLILSSVNTTVHIGAHVDAPNHYHPDGMAIDSRDLIFYLGGCQVIPVINNHSRITPLMINDVDIKAQRILFKTNSFPDPEHWNDDFCSLSPELVDYLSKKRVMLVGIDTPSIDPWDSKKLESHQAVFKNNMAILEGIVLNHVDAGVYTLVALPLKIKGGDASPVRAILIHDFNP